MNAEFSWVATCFGDITAFISEATAINDAIVDDPSIVNSDPTGEGWFFKLKLANPSDADGLMDEDAYNAMVG